MALLVWTAADLSNASLCALDNEERIAFAGSQSGVVDMSRDRGPAQAPQPHIDDCFCCSHCVDVQSVSPSTLAAPVELQLTPLVIAAPRLFGSPLYHPPVL